LERVSTTGAIESADDYKCIEEALKALKPVADVEVELHNRLVVVRVVVIVRPIVPFIAVVRYTNAKL